MKLSLPIKPHSAFYRKRKSRISCEPRFYSQMGGGFGFPQQWLRLLQRIKKRRLLFKAAVYFMLPDNAFILLNGALICFGVSAGRFYAKRFQQLMIDQAML